MTEHTDALPGIPLTVKREADHTIITTKPDASMRAVTAKLGGLK